MKSLGAEKLKRLNNIPKNLYLNFLLRVSIARVTS